MYSRQAEKKTKEPLSKNFEAAMNILQSISPVRGNSMKFQKEREIQTGQHDKKRKIFKSYQPQDIPNKRYNEKKNLDKKVPKEDKSSDDQKENEMKKKGEQI